MLLQCTRLEKLICKERQFFLSTNTATTLDLSMSLKSCFQVSKVFFNSQIFLNINKANEYSDVEDTVVISRECSSLCYDAVATSWCNVNNFVVNNVDRFCRS